MSGTIKRSAKKFVPVFANARDQKLNEADTVTRISKFLEEVLGYDALEDFTKEHTVKDRYVDIALKLSGNFLIFVEVKAAYIELREKHIEQACNYAANSGTEWVILTNGPQWQLYHVTFEGGIDSELLFTADLLEDFKDAIQKLEVLQKKAVLHGSLQSLLERHQSLHPKNLLQAVLSHDSLRTIRKQVRKLSGALLPEVQLIEAIKGVLKEEVWEQIANIKAGKKLKSQRKRKKRASRDEGDSSKLPFVVQEAAEERS